jgi:hypothetical protein
LAALGGSYRLAADLQFSLVKENIADKAAD